MKRIFKNTVLVLFVTTIWHGCTEDYFSGDLSVEDWRPEFAMPLVKSTLSLQDIVVKSDTNGFLGNNPTTGVLEISYVGSIKSPQGSLALDLPNQSFQESFMLPAPIPPSPFDTSFSEDYSTEIDFDNNGTDMEVDSILFKQGNMRFIAQNDFDHNVEINVNFPTFKNKAGNTLTLNFDLAPTSSKSSTISLIDFTADMTKDKDGMSAINKIPINISSTFNLSANMGTNANDAISIDANLTNLEFKEFHGYAGQVDLDLEEDTVFTRIFDNFKEGNIFLTNPTIDIIIHNSFGARIDLDFEKLIGINFFRSPDRINIRLPQNPISLNSPGGVGTAQTNILLDTNTSNIDSVLSFLMKQLVYKSTGRFNPLGPIERNFISDTSSIGIDLEVKIPFDGHVSNFTLVDTLDFAFENSANIEGDGLVRVKIENGFPVDASLQVIFVDGNFQALDSLFGGNQDTSGVQPIIASSIVDANGRTVQNTSTITDVIISTERVDKWNQSEYTIIKAELKSKNAPNQTIQFFEDYQFIVNMGIKAQFLID